MSQTIAGPSWLVDDLLDVESLLEKTAGASAHPLVSEPSLHLLKAGGKRVRPALVMLSSRVGTQTPATRLAAAAIELVHLATLYHDDVIDSTELRRGVPTTHARWGIEIAVLSGDYLFACGCALGAEASGEVPSILARAIAEVCEGQIVETAALGDPHRPVEDFISTIKMKTAALFRSACELGAATSGASTAERAALTTFGENLGLAFQIVDDLLDLIGDPAITGKELGTDVKDGVFTLPVLLAASRDESFADSLKNGHKDLAGVLPTLKETGALADSYARAESFGKAATEAVATLNGGEWAEVLTTMVSGVLAQVARPD
jgi:heptaprenyl diphosphate synthase